jgi:hypothetical protein
MSFAKLERMADWYAAYGDEVAETAERTQVRGKIIVGLWTAPREDAPEVPQRARGTPGA